MYSENDFEAMGPLPPLAAGEHILWRGKPKKSAYIADKALTMLPIAVVWFFFDLQFLRVAADPTLLLFLLLHLFPVWLWLGNAVTSVVQWRNEDYFVTNKRVIIRRGVFKPSRESVFLRDVHTIRVHYGLLDRIFGSGDIYINYAVQRVGRSRTRTGHFLLNLADPQALHDRIELLAMDAGAVQWKEEIEY